MAPAHLGPLQNAGLDWSRRLQRSDCSPPPIDRAIFIFDMPRGIWVLRKKTKIDWCPQRKSGLHYCWFRDFILLEKLLSEIVLQGCLWMKSDSDSRPDSLAFSEKYSRMELRNRSFSPVSRLNLPAWPLLWGSLAVGSALQIGFIPSEINRPFQTFVFWVFVLFVKVSSDAALSVLDVCEPKHEFISLLSRNIWTGMAVTALGIQTSLCLCQFWAMSI